MDCYQKLRQTLFLRLDFERIGYLSDAVIRKEVKIVIDRLVDDRFPHVDENELQAAQQRLKSEIETFTKEKFVRSCQQYREDLPPPRWRIGSWKSLPFAVLWWLFCTVLWVFVWPLNLAQACLQACFPSWQTAPEREQEGALLYVTDPWERLRLRFLLDELRESGRFCIARPICDCCCEDLDLIAHGTGQMCVGGAWQAL